MKMTRIVFAATLGTLALAVNVASAQQYVYPKAGQSPQQQQQDDYQCHQWAAQQTGYDPTRATPQPAPQSDAGGTVAKGVLKGAAGGAIIGSIADGDTGKAAAAGAVIGGLRGARQHGQVTQQQAAVASGSADAYQRAKAACMEGRGYTVK
jgi:hypothetical protein